MRRILFCVLIAIVTSAPLTRAQNQTSGLDMLSSLSRHNQIPQLIQASNELLKSPNLTTVQRSTILTYLGHAYQTNGDFHSATSYYEKALALLEHDGLYPADYATTLGALATLYAETGQTSTAKHVLLRSIRLLEQNGDHHAELAMFWNDLATISAEQHSFRDAHKYMTSASAELQRATDAPADEPEALCTTQARIAEMEGDFPAAIAGYQRSLTLWRQTHEEQHPETAMLYVLLGGAYLEAGNISSAREMTTRGLHLMEATTGRQSTRYLVAELAYSKVLDASGSHDEASKYRKEAQTAMTAQTKSAKSEISVNALR